MKVIDSSSLCKYVNREPGWPEVRNELENRPVTLNLALEEVGSSLWKRVLKKEIDADLAKKIYSKFLSSSYEPGNNFIQVRYPNSSILEIALELALKHRLAIYDTLFIALCLNLETDLITSDATQRNVTRALGIAVKFIE